jgi:hypothetical protein
MGLPELLRDRRSSILRRWKAMTLEVYADEAARFIRDEKDPFQNPVGHAITEGLDVLLDGVLAGAAAEDIEKALDAIVRIRAVQGLPPSQGVGFIFILKQIIREEAGDMPEGRDGLAELSVLDSRIDHVALAAFDLYMRCREKICDIRVNEIKHLTSKLIERAERSTGSLEDGMEEKGGSGE